MSKPKKDKIPFKDRKVVKWAKENAPDLIGNSLEFMGDLTGIEMVENLGKKIAGSDELTPEQKAEAAELIKLDLDFEKEITARWVADSGSDSWLAKNARPIVLLACVGMLFLFITFDSLNIKFEIKEQWISLYEMVLIVTIGGYFSARTVDKFKK